MKLTEPPEKPEALSAKKNGRGTSLFIGLAILAGVVGFAGFLLPNFLAARAEGNVTSCQSNLYLLGTAYEQYRADFQGRYPNDIGQLTPKYMRTLPSCPSGGNYIAEAGANAAYNSEGFEDYYFLQCQGDAHKDTGTPKNFPQWDPIHRLIPDPTEITSPDP